MKEPQKRIANLWFARPWVSGGVTQVLVHASTYQGPILVPAFCATKWMRRITQSQEMEETTMGSDLGPSRSWANVPHGCAEEFDPFGTHKSSWCPFGTPKTGFLPNNHCQKALASFWNPKQVAGFFCEPGKSVCHLNPQTSPTKIAVSSLQPPSNAQHITGFLLDPPFPPKTHLKMRYVSFWNPPNPPHPPPKTQLNIQEKNKQMLCFFLEPRPPPPQKKKKNKDKKKQLT